MLGKGKKGENRRERRKVEGERGRRDLLVTIILGFASVFSYEVLGI